MLSRENSARRWNLQIGAYLYWRNLWDGVRFGKVCCSFRVKVVLSSHWIIFTKLNLFFSRTLASPFPRMQPLHNCHVVWYYYKRLFIKFKNVLGYIFVFKIAALITEFLCWAMSALNQVEKMVKWLVVRCFPEISKKLLSLIMFHLFL